MEYSIGAFTEKLKEYFVDSPLFPYMYLPYKSSWGIEQTSQQKHPKRNPPHLRDEVKNCFAQTTIVSDDTIIFDYGSEKLETYYPYYHILEDAPVIRKAYRGTEKTKGTQDMIKNVGKRDYGYVYWNGKTFTKEYARNVRGSRNRIESVSHWTVKNGTPQFVNRESNSYNNVHYHYIENILNQDVNYKLASEFDLRLLRTQTTDLKEEFAMQEDVDIESVLETFKSFE